MPIVSVTEMAVEALVLITSGVTNREANGCQPSPWRASNIQHLAPQALSETRQPTRRRQGSLVTNVVQSQLVVTDTARLKLSEE